MLKIWLAIGLAAIVAVITMLMGLINQARFTVILYRTIISIAVFGSCGYLMGIVFDKKIMPYIIRLNSKQEQEISENQSLEENMDNNRDETVSEKIEATAFAPFTADNLNRVSPPNS